MTSEAGYVLPVDKPEGPTSHDVVDAARRALGVRKIGHTGTLDPFASGLMLLCVGRATRIAEYLSGQDKSYLATARLGVATDTLDRDGEVIEEREGWRELEAAAVATALGRFHGAVEQVPPQYSAKKVGGVAMHRRARAGERVELAPCRVTVHEVELIDYDPPDARFRVRCSSGTYVRALARDLGEGLGVGAHLTVLRRTHVGSVSVEAGVALDRLGDPEAVSSARIGLLEALGHLPRLEVGLEATARLAHGQRLRVEEAMGDPHAVAGLETGLCALGHAGELVAVAELIEGVLCPRKVFVA